MIEGDSLTEYTAQYVRDLHNVVGVFCPETVVVKAVKSISGFGKHQISFNQDVRRSWKFLKEKHSLLMKKLDVFIILTTFYP